MREIDLIIDENESQVVEWKESWQDKYLMTMVTSLD